VDQSRSPLARGPNDPSPTADFCNNIGAMRTLGWQAIVCQVLSANICLGGRRVQKRSSVSAHAGRFDRTRPLIDLAPDEIMQVLSRPALGDHQIDPYLIEPGVYGG